MVTAAMTVAFLGTGALGEALLKGSLDGGLAARDVWVTARSQRRVDDLMTTYRVRGTTDNAEAASSVRIVVLAVPPADVAGVLAEIAGHLSEDVLVVSLADGISLADLEGQLPDGAAAARAMPSLTAQVGHGLTLLTMNDSCSPAQADAVRHFFERSGEVLVVDEEQQAVLSPLSSGGPAYFFYVADAMVEAGAIRGIPRDLARRLVAQVLAGSAAWLQDGAVDPAALCARVSPPGGAGSRRIGELDERGIRAAFVEALTRKV